VKKYIRGDLHLDKSPVVRMHDWFRRALPILGMDYDDMYDGIGRVMVTQVRLGMGYDGIGRVMVTEVRKLINSGNVGHGLR
jgi:hypothetical protein